MIIAFDFDGTLNRSGTIGECCMWGDVIGRLQSKKITCIICTMRQGTEADQKEIAEYQELAGTSMPVVFCGQYPDTDGYKRTVALAAGYKVDIWVDDMPESISPPVTMIQPPGGVRVR